jgi:drug/metabolite transporter (DMT)-like permease
VSGITFGANAVILRKAKDQNPQDILLAANIPTALVSIPFFFLALVSGITFGANAVILRKAKDQNPQDILLSANIQAALISIPFFFIYPPAFGFTNVFGIIFLGFFQIGTASVLFAYGMRRVAVIQAMLTIMIEPVLNPVWVLLATGEKPSVTVIIGGGIIIAAVAMSSIITVKLSASRPRN